MVMPISSAKWLVEGGLLASIVVVVAWIDIGGAVVDKILAVPLAFFVIRHGVRRGLVLLGAVAMASVGLFSAKWAIFFMLDDALVATALGLCFRHGVSVIKSVAVTSAVAFVLEVLLIVGMALVVELDLVQIADGCHDGFAAFHMELGRMLGSDLSEAEMAARGDRFGQQVLWEMPGVLLVWAIYRVTLNVMALRFVMQHLRMVVPVFRSFDQWRFPIWVLVVYAVSLVGRFADCGEWTMIVDVVGSNVNMVMGQALVVQAVSLLYYLSKHGYPALSKVWLPAALASYFVPLADVPLMFIGGADMIFDHRRVLARRRGDGERV